MELTNNAKVILEKRYLKDNESPEDMLRRVAKTVASAELQYGKSESEVKEWEEKFYQIMDELYFLPNSPTLMNAGYKDGQLSACFTWPVDDSMESIFEAIKQSALIFKSGGGCGYSFGRLRPEGDIVHTTGGTASGPISFMKVFNEMTEAVKQGGKRRGAALSTLPVHHPDIFNFIRIKEASGVLENFNLSVSITDHFMNCVLDDKDFELSFNNKVYKVIKAKDLFNLLCEKAWKSGEPGIIFIDTVNACSPHPNLKIESPNPCSEAYLLPAESCNLGSINLGKILRNRTINYDLLNYLVRTSIRFLDNIIDVTNFPNDLIKEQTLSMRKIGLGVMGWADLLSSLNIQYDSEEAFSLANNLMKFINDIAFDESSKLGNEKGSFPALDLTIYGGPLRNAVRTAIAPTGTLSLIAGCSSGIEPYFSHDYSHDSSLSGNSVDSLNLSAPLSAKTAHEISYQDHIRMLSTFQKHVNNGISKTINFSNSATIEDIKNAYLLAYSLGCKGLTVYRDGSRSVQVLNSKKEEKEEVIKIKDRKQSLNGTTTKLTTGCGSLYITVNYDENGPFEVFSTLGKAGGCAAAQSEAISRLISLSLRSGISVDDIIHQLENIRCPSPAWGANGRPILSCPDALAKVLKGFPDSFPRENVPEENNPEKIKIANDSGQCPECSTLLIYQEGCYLCRHCGFTKCG